MAASISAVAAICASAPSSTQGQKLSPGRGSGDPVAMSTPARKTSSEGKTEQKPHMRRADGAETAGQLALHRVAQGLGKSGNDGEDGPKPAGQHYAAFSATTM